MLISEVPRTAAPLHRALAEQGWTSLADLAGRPRTAILALHGVGRASLARVEAAMAGEGLALTDGQAVWTATDRGEAKAGTGVPSSDITTTATDAGVREFVDSLEPRRAAHGRELLRIFGEVTGAEPRMWGPSMIGYGEMHYVYATGREGDTMRLGFSPRKAAISLYGLPSEDPLLASLGKHRRAKSCIYVNTPTDIDESVLRELISRAWNAESASGR
nr:helix-hairpin-helix domain-containing protein [Actinomycetales bacterium]